MLILSQIFARVASHAAASTSSPSFTKELLRVGNKAYKPLQSHHLVEGEASCKLEQVCDSLRGSWTGSARIPLGPIRRHSRPSYLFLNTYRQFTASRAFRATRETSMPAPAFVPIYIVYSLARVWILKPMGVLFKALTFGNTVKVYRVVVGIRNSWEYKLARRMILSVAALAAVGGAAILVACDFDDARAAAVLTSIPRTVSSAGWCMHAALTYKMALMGHSDSQSAEYQAALKEAHQQCADRLVNMCGSNGGIYVKAAQFIASMQTTPIEYRRALEKLQDQAEPQDFEDAKRVLESELGQPLEDLFDDFEPMATAAASLAQVHKARLKDGKQVAVKVQYLGLESAVAADLSTLSLLGAIAALVFPNSFEFGWVVRRLGANLEKELDFGIEAQNALRLQKCMANNPCIAVPESVARCSTRRVLTMEWVEGVKLNNRKGMVDLGIRPREAATQLLKAFGQMIYIHGFVHADPHAGNILVRQRPGKQSWRWLLFGLGWRQPQIVLLDHGLYVDLPDSLRQNYCALWCSFLVNNMTTATAVSQKIAGERGGKLLPKLLKPGELASKEQKEVFRKENGIEGLGDIGRLIEGLPEEFLQLLRIVGVVRPTAFNLGASHTDRLRINATCAYEGLWKQKEAIPESLDSVGSRLYMKLTLDILRAIFYVNCAAQELFDCVTFLPTKIAHTMYEARYT